MKYSVFFCVLFSALDFELKSQSELKFYLLPSIAAIDTDKDKIISPEEAELAFENYFRVREDSISGNPVHTDDAMLDLIAYLEGVDLSEIKKTGAEKKFIEIYYSSRFLSKYQDLFGVPLGFTENEDYYDSNYVSEPLLPLLQYPTKKIDGIISMQGQMTSVSQFPFQKYFNQKRSDDLAGEWTAQTLFVATLPIEINAGKFGAFNITPEYAGGNGLGDGAGIASYPNALFGFPQSKPYLLRAQYFKEFDIASHSENQSTNKVMILAGRFILQEAFLASGWSGDPKRDFLNFNHTMHSAWDAATTAYGFTHGLAGRISNEKYALSFAACTVDEEAGGIKTDWRINKANSFNLQYSRRVSVGNQFFNWRVLGYTNRTWSGVFDAYHPDSLGIPFDFPDSLKTFHTKFGLALDCDYEFNEYTGVFLRFSINDGKSESMGYTQADRAINVGFSRFMDFIDRSDDMFGLAFSINGISQSHRQFVNEGGNGFMLSGGPIVYGTEQAFETFYRYAVFHNAELTLNYQCTVNPGYNKNNCLLHTATCRFNFQF